VTTGSGSRLQQLAGELRERNVSPEVSQRILESISDGRLGERSSVGWHRLLESLGDGIEVASLIDSMVGLRSIEGLLQGLSTLLGSSPYFTDMVCARPGRLSEVLTMGPLYRHRTRDAMDAYLRQRVQTLGETDFDRRRDEVAEFQRLELLRIGLRDYGEMADLETNARELSDLADVLIRWACREAWQEVVLRHGRPERAPGESTGEGAADGTESSLLVVGMGKLGGRELNFSSDIDLVFLYEAEGQTTGRSGGLASVSHHQFFGTLSERISRILGQRGAYGQFYRVDLRLRPEGKLGPVARSLESLESYFGEQARDWERVSWLKARAITGAPRLIHRFGQVVTGFVYSPILPEQMFSEVESLKKRIDAAIGAADSGLCMDVKRGRGGIREIEFTVTVLQVLYGNRHRALRVRPLLMALARLAQVGLISGEDPMTLAINYGHLRRVEHRLQMEHGRQEHCLPAPGERRDVLAASLGLVNGDGLTQFMNRATSAVHAWYGRFFEADRCASTDEDDDVALILSPVADPDLQAAALFRRGFSNPQTARLLRSLAFGTFEVFVSAAGQRAFEQLVPGLLRLAAGRPKPDHVIVHFHTLMHRLQSASYYYEVLAGHPGVLRMISFLFGTSDHLSEVLLACPEYFDRIIQGDILDETGPEERATALVARISSQMAHTTQFKARPRILRRAAEFEILAAYLAWLVNVSSLEETLTYLSDGADCVVRSALGIALDLVAQRHQLDDEGSIRLQRAVGERLVVLAMGKYGSRELNFRGDLDVLFVDLESNAAADHAVPLPAGIELLEVVKEIAGIMGEGTGIGRGHVLDTRLRPWGVDGPLIPSSQAVNSYVSQDAAAWEFLSYQRVRAVVGPDQSTESWLGQFSDLVRQSVCQRMGKAEFLEEVLSMRVRLEDQVPSQVMGLELKRSAGGLMDAEFALEAWLAIGCPMGSKLDRVTWGRSHFQWWDELRLAGIGPDGIAEEIGICHAQLRLAENVARTVIGTASSVLSLSGGEGSDALWRNLAIVGIPHPEFLQRMKDRMRTSYVIWMRWLKEKSST
jgi:glutamate-ammonia-ligase adenylyltransferase